MSRQLADLRLAWRIALREMRSGLHGFRIFLACIVLGVGAIAMIGSLSAALERGVDNEGQALLGGDIEFSVVHRELTEAELGFLQARGTVSTVATVRAMAHSSERVLLVEVKAVDHRYPLYGSLDLDGDIALAEALAPAEGRFGVVVEPLILSRFGLAPGETLRLGDATFDVRAAIVREPDRAADGFILGPRVLMSREALDATGLVRPGSLITWRYRVQLPAGASARDVAALRQQAIEAFPDAGWSIRTRDRAVPGIERFLDRLTFLLTLVGLTALIVGGLGIANAVSAFLERKRGTIAVLKCLGASSALVFRVYLIEVLIIASLGIALALALGAAVPFLVEGLFGDALPVPIAAGFDPAPLGIALAFGYLVTLAFALWPLAIARTVAPTALFRMAAVASRPLPELRFLGIIAAVSGAHRRAGAWRAWRAQPHAVVSRRARRQFRAAVGDGGSSHVGGRALAAAEGRDPAICLCQPLSPRRADVIHRGVAGARAGAVRDPGADGPQHLGGAALLGAGTGAVVLLPRCPVVGTRRHAGPSRQPARASGVETAPMLRGRVQRLNGLPVSQVRPDPEVAWAVRGDRGLTYAGICRRAPPWSPATGGRPAMTGRRWCRLPRRSRAACASGSAIPSPSTCSAATSPPRSPICAGWTGARCRSISPWCSRPTRSSGAPHANIVTVSSDEAAEDAMLSAVAAAFPTVTAVRVRDVLAAVDELLGKLIVGVRAASASPSSPACSCWLAPWPPASADASMMPPC
jgi:putative ABC transport system permease protein